MRAVIASVMLAAAGFVEDTGWASEPRPLDVDVHGDGFDADLNGTVNWSYDRDGLALHIHADDGTANATAQLRFEALVEFQDRDGDGRYGLGDPVIRQVDLADVRGGAPSEAAGPGPARSVAATYRLPPDFFPTMTLSFMLTPEPMPSHDPVAINMTVRIADFPFETDNMTHLALVARITPALDRDGMVSGGGAVSLEMRWAGNATTVRYSADRPQSVVAWSQPRGAFEQSLQVAAVRLVAVPDDTVIEHIAGNPLAFAAGLAVMATGLGLTVWWRRRA